MLYDRGLQPVTASKEVEASFDVAVARRVADGELRLRERAEKWRPWRACAALRLWWSEAGP